MGLNTFDTYVNVHKFIRKLHMKKYYVQNPMETTHIQGDNTLLRNKSVFNPTINPTITNNRSIDMFKKCVIAELDTLPITEVYEQRD